MAKILPVKIYPCPVLLEPTRELTIPELRTDQIQQLILDMTETMKAKDGVGLAAPQVGRSLKLVIITTADGNLALINPKILRRSWKKETTEEGCLSIPKVFGLVKRSRQIKLVALDKNGKKIKLRAIGYLARVIQHEIDHINGVLFIDRTQNITTGQPELERLKNLPPANYEY